MAILHDVEIEVPAPDKSSQAGSVIGVPAKILRLKIPQLEVAFSHTTESTTPGSHTLRAKVEDFTPSSNSQVLAINEDASKPTADPVQRGAGHHALGARLRSLPITASLDNLNVRGFAIQSISPLDPSGWMRLSLSRTAAAAPVASPPATLAVHRRECSHPDHSGRGLPLEEPGFKSHAAMEEEDQAHDPGKALAVDPGATSQARGFLLGLRPDRGDAV